MLELENVKMLKSLVTNETSDSKENFDFVNLYIYLSIHTFNHLGIVNTLIYNSEQ